MSTRPIAFPDKLHSMITCPVCGEQFIPKTYHHKYCSSYCGGIGWRTENPEQMLHLRRKWLRRTKTKAHLKLARVWTDTDEIKCHHCGFSDIGLLDFGHPDNNGNEHTKNRSMAPYALVMGHTTEEIKSWNIRTECCFCNQFYKRKFRYPTLEERKEWGGGV